MLRLPQTGCEWNPFVMRPRKAAPPSKPDNPEQYRRFVEAAREAAADESPDAMDRAFKLVVGRKKKTMQRARPAKQEKYATPSGVGM
jgi:hypothetical protein